MTIDRRQFLKLAAGGGAIVTMPAVLAGCGVLPGISPGEPTPQNPFLAWFGIDERALGRLTVRLAVAGADGGEAYFQHRRRTVLTMIDGELAAPRVNIDNGAGLRVTRGDSSGFAVTEDLSPAALLSAAAEVAAGAEDSGGKRNLSLREGGVLYKASRYWEDVADAERIAILTAVSEQAMAADSRITGASLHWQDSDERVLIATLDGEAVTDRRPLTRLSLQVTAERGGRRVAGFAATAARDGLSWYTPERLRELVQKAVERTLLQFDARQPPYGDMPVVLAAGGAAVILHETAGHSLEADFVLGGGSRYAGKEGQAVAAGGVTLVDEAAVPHARGALNVDDEGSTCQRNVLIEDGVLRGFLHDRRTARHFGVPATGSARRESFRHEPMPRMTCTRLADGTASRQDIIAAVERGILAETITGARLNPDDGRFEVNVKNGWLIEQGQPSMPVRDLRLAGDASVLLERIAMIGNDGRFDSGGWTCGKAGQRVPVSQGMPTALVETMEVLPAAG